MKVFQSLQSYRVFFLMVVAPSLFFQTPSMAAQETDYLFDHYSGRNSASKGIRGADVDPSARSLLMDGALTKDSGSWKSKVTSFLPSPAVPATPSNSVLDYSSDIPKVVLAGLEAYTTGGAASAVSAWITGGPMEGDPSALSGADTFRTVEAHYGRYTGYQLLQIKSLSPTSKLVYLQMNYEKGPLYLRFLCYWTGGSWIITGRLVINTDPQEVLAKQ